MRCTVQENEHTLTPENTRMVNLSPSLSAIGPPFSNGTLTIIYSSLTQPMTVEKCCIGLMVRCVMNCILPPTCRFICSNSYSWVLASGGELGAMVLVIRQPFGQLGRVVEMPALARLWIHAQEHVFIIYPPT